MTEAEGRVLEALERVTAGGWPASIRDVAREAGLSAVSTAYWHLLSLEAQGLAETDPTRRRGWRPRRPTAAIS